nr:unnamed protein product [Callosobruchus chinensis]
MPKNEFSAFDRTRIIALWQEGLSRHQIANRLIVWARAHQDWLLPQWRNVLFSDESRFGLVSDDYQERVWRERGGQNRLATVIDETLVLPYAPGDIESVVENERCRIYWNYSFPTLELVQANKPDIVLLDHQQKTMFVIEFSAPAEVNIVSKEEEKWTKYQELLGQLRRLWPGYTVSLLVMVIGSLGGMRNTLLFALRAMPVCRAAAHILAARMQKAVILGSLRLLRAHDTRTQ